MIAPELAPSLRQRLISIIICPGLVPNTQTCLSLLLHRPSLIALTITQKSETSPPPRVLVSQQAASDAAVGEQLDAPRLAVLHHAIEGTAIQQRELDLGWVMGEDRCEWTSCVGEISMGWNGGTDHSFICPLKASSILLSPTHLVACYGHTSIADL